MDAVFSFQKVLLQTFRILNNLLTNTHAHKKPPLNRFSWHLWGRNDTPWDHYV